MLTYDDIKEELRLFACDRRTEQLVVDCTNELIVNDGVQFTLKEKSWSYYDGDGLGFDWDLARLKLSGKILNPSTSSEKNEIKRRKAVSKLIDGLYAAKRQVTDWLFERKEYQDTLTKNIHKWNEVISKYTNNAAEIILDMHNFVQCKTIVDEFWMSKELNITPKASQCLLRTNIPSEPLFSVLNDVVSRYECGKSGKVIKFNDNLGAIVIPSDIVTDTVFLEHYGRELVQSVSTKFLELGEAKQVSLLNN